VASVRTVLPRPVTEADTILGVRPEIVYEPRTVEEAAEILRETASDGKRLAFVGGGTDLEIGGPLQGLDAVMRTGGLSRIIEHAPADQIVVVEAGVTLATLQTALAEHGQRLALDPPLPERATVGGIVAANAFGPRRARYGSVRDLIIGVSLVRADGTLARGGGKVVKNVAGFDLPKLMVGSLGTLGMIATATFRLHPLPEISETLLLPEREPKEVRALAARIKEAQLEPTSVVAILRAGGGFEVAVRLEGFRAGVAEQQDRLAALLREESGAVCEVLDRTAAGSFWARHDALRVSSPLRAKLAALPSAIDALAADVLPHLLSTLESPSFVWYATLGLGFVCGVPGPADAVAAAVERARTLLSHGGGSLTLLAAPPPIRQRLDVWGPPPPAVSLMRSVKERLDPQRRLAPGRFVGGI
jgi:glycolate oxidase FAD binding subunit